MILNPFYIEPKDETKKPKRSNNKTQTRSTSVVRRIIEDARAMQARGHSSSNIGTNNEGTIKCGEQ